MYIHNLDIKGVTISIFLIKIDQITSQPYASKSKKTITTATVTKEPSIYSDFKEPHTAFSLTSNSHQFSYNSEQHLLILLTAASR